MTRLEKSFAGVLICVVMAAAIVVFNRFHLTTDLGAFLPKGNSRIETLMVDLLDKGTTSNLVFIGIRGAKAGELAKVNNELAIKLKESPHILAVQ